jgi:DNA repair exonuclease SbcCD ATPase subunit
VIQALSDSASQRDSLDLVSRSEDQAVTTADGSLDAPRDTIDNDGSGQDTGHLTQTEQDALSTTISENIVPDLDEPSVDLPVPEAPTESIDPNRIKELEAALETTVLQHQEETHSYVERIDALEAKLQYLAREATDSARKAAIAAPAGSLEKKLAEKDEQIAQLLEEGKNLASTEQKHRTIMKKLRSKIAEDEQEIKTLKASRDKSAKEMDTLRAQAKAAQDMEKTRDSLLRRIEQLQRDVTTAQSETTSRDATIADLKSRLQKATEQGEAMSAKINEQAKEQDRKRIAELEESVAALEVEKNLVADRAKIQANELKEKAERASERSRALELELKAEVQVMESKLEAMRMRAEEASSGATGDSQAKLLRQIETLQQQYSIATDNWQGIEGTLLARVSNLEKERDEALQRESEMRKKAREAVSLLPSYRRTCGLSFIGTDEKFCPRLNVHRETRKNSKRPRRGYRPCKTT